MLLIDRNLKPKCLKNSPGSTMVKRSPPCPNPEVKGSNPPAGKEKKGKKLLLSDRKLKPRYFQNSPGACIIKLIKDVLNGFRNKLECLSLASLSNLVLCLGTNTLAYYGNRKLHP